METYTKKAAKYNIRSVRLEDICNPSKNQTPNEPVIPNVLPTFFHILLTWLHAEKITGRGVVVVTVASGAQAASN